MLQRRLGPHCNNFDYFDRAATCCSSVNDNCQVLANCKLIFDIVSSSYIGIVCLKDNATGCSPMSGLLAAALALATCLDSDSEDEIAGPQHGVDGLEEMATLFGQDGYAGKSDAGVIEVVHYAPRGGKRCRSLTALTGDAYQDIIIAMYDQ